MIFENPFILNPSQFYHHQQQFLLVLLCIVQIISNSLQLQVNLSENVIQKLAAKCEKETQIEQSKQPFFYSFELKECKITCYTLITNPDYDSVYYDDTQIEVHNLDMKEPCKGYLSYCKDGECKVPLGRLLIIIFSAKHDLKDNKPNDISPGDPYVKILVGKSKVNTEVVDNTFVPIFNSSVTYKFENVPADEKLTLYLKDKNKYLDQLIDMVTITPGEIMKNNLSGVKKFYSFNNESEFGITALITFVLNKE